MKSVLVTGSAGFIGHKTAEKLLQQGYKVIGADNLNDYYDIRLKEHRLAQLQQNDNFRFYGIDIEERSALEKIFRDNEFGSVINLAARAGVRYSIENPYVYLSTNVLGMLNLLELMHVYEVPKMVFASSSSLYAGEGMPFLETLEVNKPISQYAATKKAAEMMAYTYHHLYKLDISIMRYFTVYGPAGRPDMSYFRFIKWIDNGQPIELFGDGTQTRDFTYIDDIADATIAAMKPLGYEIINAGGGKKPVSINYMISLIEKYLDKKAKIEYKEFHNADMKDTSAEISKAKKLLGWEPKIDIEDGIKSAVEWYLENKHWVKDIEL